MKVAFSLSLLTFAIIAAAPAGAQQTTGVQVRPAPPPPLTASSCHRRRRSSAV